MDDQQYTGLVIDGPAEGQTVTHHAKQLVWNGFDPVIGVMTGCFYDFYPSDATWRLTPASAERWRLA